MSTKVTILSTLLVCSSTIFASTPYIIPLPSEMTVRNEKAFASGRPLSLSVDTDVDTHTYWIANNLVRDFSGQRNPDINAKAHISVTPNFAIPAEGYTLSVTPDTIKVSASSPEGFFYAFQSLRQLHDSSGDGTIAAVEIFDEPRMKWRGFMLDEGRHFFGKDEVKKVIDLMALYKFNKLHWHLTEDQGWRLPVDKWPKLTEVGGWRDSEKLGWKDRKPEPSDTPYGGFYTPDDIREIVDYARERFIEIIPEVDMPGHTQAMVAAYPDLLACDADKKHSVWDRAGVSTDVMNVASPIAVEMSKDIIDNLIRLFPSRYIHLGGDECPTDKWEKNMLCRDRLREIGSDNFRDLQLDFYNQLQEHINSKPESQRRRLILWNEVLHGDSALLPDSIMVMAWIGTEEAERDGRLAASRGYDVIMTPQVPYYINRRQSTDSREPNTQGPGTESLEKVYNYKPFSDVPDSLINRYQGVQANFWSEFVPDAATLEYLMLPRLTAVAEAAWTPAYKRNYADYLQRLKGQEKMLRNLGYNYAPYVFEK